MTTQHHPWSGAALDYEHGKAAARHIFLAVMASLDVRRAMLSKLRFADGVLLAGEQAIPVAKPPYVVAFGKAALRMAETFSEILGGEAAAGVVVAPAPFSAGRKLHRFVYYEAGHPYPNSGSLEGAAAALDLVSGLTPDDLVIFLVSGGGSALFEKPLDGEITLADLAEFNRVLVTGDMPIEQMNVLRKHISAVKGGRLTAAAFPARQFTVYISDVPGEMPSMVASGPTFPDETTLDQCYALAEQNRLVTKFPPRIRKLFEQRSLAETPKPGHEWFSRSEYFCLLSNRDAVETARQLAAECGFHAGIEPGVWDADYRQVAGTALDALDAQDHPGKPLCLVVGGEVTCPVTGHGVGGRNLSFALVAAQKIEGKKQVALSCATDGRDGNSPSCGAVADGHTLSRARALGLDAARSLKDSDAYHFFRALGDTIETGFTDNNVRDLRLFMSFE